MCVCFFWPWYDMFIFAKKLVDWSLFCLYIFNTLTDHMKIKKRLKHPALGGLAPHRVLLMGEIWQTHQLRLVVYLIIYRVYISQLVSRISEPSTVVKSELHDCRTRRVHMRRISILPLTLWLVKMLSWFGKEGSSGWKTLCNAEDWGLWRKYMDLL